MASFKAKTRRDQLRMRGTKNYRSDPFKPFSEQGIPKKQQKIKKTSIWLLLKPKRDGRG